MAIVYCFYTSTVQFPVHNVVLSILGCILLYLLPAYVSYTCKYLPIMAFKEVSYGLLLIEKKYCVVRYVLYFPIGALDYVCSIFMNVDC